MGTPSWQSQPDTWDRMKLGDDWLPGPVEVTIKDVSSGLDVRKAPKSNRATLVDQGYEPIKVTVKLTIGFNPSSSAWPSALEQFSQWLKINEKLRPKRAQKRNALTVSHPQLAIFGVSRVFVDSISGLSGSGPGSREITISLIEQAPVVSSASFGGSGAVQAGPAKAAPPISTLSKAPSPAKTATKP